MSVELRELHGNGAIRVLTEGQNTFWPSCHCLHYIILEGKVYDTG